jgi:hypothetical protein
VEIALADIQVMYVASMNGPEGAKEAFIKVEDALGWKLKGRRFYGTMLDGEYRACVAIDDADEPARLGLQPWTIPGGRYIRARIKDWEQHLNEIGPAFGRLKEQHGSDPTRPGIEYYRSQTELLIYHPIP